MMKRVGFASLSLLGALSLAPSLHAQTQAPAPLPPPGAPPAPPAAAAPAPNAAPAAPAANPPAVNASASSDGFDIEASTDANEAPPTPADEDREWRATSLHLGNTLSGSTGLLHVSEAGAGAPGTFRFAATGSYFSGSGFLCNSNSACPASSPGQDRNSSDNVSRTGMDLGLSATLLPFLEAFGGFHNRATSDSRGRPQLLQVLGDTNLGLKAFTPHRPDSIFSFGGEANLLLLNGTGGVGLNGGSTSFALRALGTLDLNNRSNPEARIPLRFHANIGYLFDNSGQIVKSIEDTAPPQGRGAPISRVERFGLGINRLDAMQMGFAAEYVNEYIRPFAEWSIDIPVNRQNYTCQQSQADANGDLCLGANQRFSTTPSRFTLGARAFPWKDHGLAVLAAFDIGTGATSQFIQEVTPELPWNFYLGIAYGFDTVAPTPVVERVVASAPPVPQENFIEGVVLEKNTQNTIADALIRYDGRPLTGMVTNADGSFRSANLPPGTYTLKVSAAGFHDGQCSATLQPLPSTQAAAAPVGAPPQPAQPELPAPASEAPNVVKIQCALESLPKVGTVVGSVMDPESNQPVPDAHITVTDKLNRKLELRADQGGAFRFENVPPGPLKFSVDAPGYFTAVAEVNVQAREEAQARILLNKHPAKPNVVVAGKEIKLKQQVHFQYDSAEILPDSQAILEELAELMLKRPDIKNVEVQGHTDNSGTAAYNLRLSQMRAQAVVDALAGLGVDPTRMTAKGYGQEKPLVSNASTAGRAKNRRVQIMITARGK